MGFPRTEQGPAGGTETAGAARTGSAKVAVRLAAAYPILFAGYPVIAFYAHNQAHHPARSVALPLLASLAAAVLLFGAIFPFARNVHVAAVRTFGILVFFFAAGQARLLVPRTAHFGEVLVPLDVIVQLLLAITAVLVFRSWARADGRVTQVLAVFTSVLVLQVLVLIDWTGGFQASKGAGGTEPGPRRPALDRNLPHIFYIVPDGYGREDVLRETYGFVNAPFLDALRKRGFFVASRARSNYAQTALSLASTLNMELVSTIIPEQPASSTDRLVLGRAIREGRVFDLLSHRGYTTVAFASGYPSTEVQTAHRYEQPAQRRSSDPFLEGFLDLTPLAHLRPALRQPSRGEQHRERVEFTLAQCAAFASEEHPVFVFAPIVLPHPPFLFDAHGRLPPGAPIDNYSEADGSHLRDRFSVTPEQYRERYVDQVRYLNGRLLVVVDEILARANRPVVILIQADHGPGSGLDWESAEGSDLRERMSILSAFRLPDGPGPGPYASMTPVNSFRILLGRTLGRALPLLTDESFFSVWSRPYEFLPLEETATGALRVRPIPRRGGPPIAGSGISIAH